MRLVVWATVLYLTTILSSLDARYQIMIYIASTMAHVLVLTKLGSRYFIRHKAQSLR